MILYIHVQCSACGAQPCLWGSVEDGLEPPPIVDGMTIKVIAVTNNTYGHHGEMALPEISLAKY
jgi:hypothetical protein